MFRFLLLPKSSLLELVIMLLLLLLVLLIDKLVLEVETVLRKFSNTLNINKIILWCNPDNYSLSFSVVLILLEYFYNNSRPNFTISNPVCLE